MSMKTIVTKPRSTFSFCLSFSLIYLQNISSEFVQFLQPRQTRNVLKSRWQWQYNFSEQLFFTFMTIQGDLGQFDTLDYVTVKQLRLKPSQSQYLFWVIVFHHLEKM